MKYFVLLSGIMLLLTSCSFDTMRKNDPADIKDGRITCDKFYELLQDQDFKAASEMFSEKVFKERSQDSSIIFLQQVQFHMGELISFEFSSGNSFVRRGTNPIAQYELMYIAVYESDSIKEKISLVEENGIRKILGYNILSDSLKIKMEQTTSDN